MKLFKNKLLTLCVLFLLCSSLCSCEKNGLTDCTWKSDNSTVEFSEDGVMTRQKQGKTEIFFYEDCKGDFGNRYIKIYHSKKEAQTGKFTEFIPYTLENSKLSMDGEKYQPEK